MPWCANILQSTPNGMVFYPNVEPKITNKTMWKERRHDLVLFFRYHICNKSIKRSKETNIPMQLKVLYDNDITY